jgi:hypothetical protein
MQTSSQIDQVKIQRENQRKTLCIFYSIYSRVVRLCRVKILIFNEKNIDFYVILGIMKKMILFQIIKMLFILYTQNNKYFE